MLTIQYLWPEEIQRLDPLGVSEKWYQSHFGPACFEPTSPLFDDIQHTVDAFRAQFLTGSPRHEPILEYDREMSRKIGRQGGRLPLTTGQSLCKQYYDVDPSQVKIDLAYLGRDLLRRAIRCAVQQRTYPTVVRKWQTQNTAAGLPRGGKKTEWRNHVDGASPWRHALPALINTRRMRNKDRIVFADACLNGDYVQPELTAVRCWLKEQFPHIFGAWLNPTVTLWPDITAHVLRKSYFLETDFKSRDRHFTWPLVRELILPIYEDLLPEGDYLHFAAMIEESFTAPLLRPGQLWTGEHALFSGRAFTNDFETIYDVCVYLAAHVVAGEPLSTFGECFKACGDDVLYAGSQATCNAVYKLVADEFKANGVILSEEKTRLQNSDARFCRCVYYGGLPRQINSEGRVYRHPAYPLSLTLNSCIQPERLQASRSEELLAVFARCDNAVGHYAWNNFVNFLFSSMKPRVLTPLRADAETLFSELQLRDWWYKVYGTTYDLGDSPTARIFKQRTH